MAKTILDAIQERTRLGAIGVTLPTRLKLQPTLRQISRRDGTASRTLAEAVLEHVNARKPSQARQKSDCLRYLRRRNRAPINGRFLRRFFNHTES